MAARSYAWANAAPPLKASSRVHAPGDSSPAAVGVGKLKVLHAVNLLSSATQPVLELNVARSHRMPTTAGNAHANVAPELLCEHVSIRVGNILEKQVAAPTPRSLHEFRTACSPCWPHCVEQSFNGVPCVVRDMPHSRLTPGTRPMGLVFRAALRSCRHPRWMLAKELRNLPKTACVTWVSIHLFCVVAGQIIGRRFPLLLLLHTSRFCCCRVILLHTLLCEDCQRLL